MSLLTSIPLPVKVVVKKATGLLAADINLVGRNSSDPFVELTTDGQHVARTKALKSTLEPVWEQTFWLTVQVCEGGWGRILGAGGGRKGVLEPVTFWLTMQVCGESVVGKVLWGRCCGKGVVGKGL